MAELVVRRLLIDLETPFPCRWFGGDAFKSALFNALSMGFPGGEQFFIDSVREGLKALPKEIAEQYKTEIQGFVGQEATHRHIHNLFNSQLEKQGMVNAWTKRTEARMKQTVGSDPRHCLAITTANEHFTAILAEWLLRNQNLLDVCEPRLKTMWLWHSTEELEHRCTAFDLYQALGGTHEWRIRWFRVVSLAFFRDTFDQTISNLKRDGMLWKWRTWQSAIVFLFGSKGIIRQNYRAWRAYLKPDFHPSHQESNLPQQWLENNTDKYIPVIPR
jgi:predicted metal-dependent hydrolase